MELEEGKVGQLSTAALTSVKYHSAEDKRKAGNVKPSQAAAREDNHAEEGRAGSRPLDGNDRTPTTMGARATPVERLLRSMGVRCRGEAQWAQL